MTKQDELEKHSKAKGTKKPKRRFILNDKEIEEQDVTQDDIDRAEHVVAGSIASGDEDISFGFTTTKKLEKWVEKQSKEEQRAYRSLRKLLDKTRKKTDLTEAELETIKQHQVDKVHRRTQVFTSLLERRGIDPQDEEKVAEVLRGLDPLYGSHSMVLCQFTWFTGRWLVVDTGAYPDLGWFDFDNRTTSYFNYVGCFAMFQYRWFGGRSYIRLSPKVQPQMSDWWDNRLTSIAYMNYWDLIEWLAYIL